MKRLYLARGSSLVSDQNDLKYAYSGGNSSASCWSSGISINSRCSIRCNPLRRADHLLSVGLGNLTHELGPRHVDSGVDLAGLGPRVVLEDFHHQGRVVRDNHAGLKQAQEPGLALGLA